MWKDFLQGAFGVFWSGKPEKSSVVRAVSEGDVERVRGFIKLINMNLDEYGLNDYNLLCLASDYNQVSVVEALIEAGADVNLCSIDGTYPITIAAEKGSVNLIKTLVKSGACFKRQDFNLLKTAIGSDDTDLMELLFIHGVDVGALDPDSCFSVMHLAFAFGKVDSIAHLVERGGDINSKYPFGGHTPLCSLATAYTPLEVKWQVVVKHLCRIDFDAPYSEGSNSMLFYVEQKCPELAEMIERFLAGESLQLQDEVAAAEESGSEDDEPPAKRARIDVAAKDDLLLAGVVTKVGDDSVERKISGDDLPIWDID